MPMDSPVKPIPLADALNTWAALQGIGKKQSTRDYHQEIVGIVLEHWPGERADVAAISVSDLTSFVLDVSKVYSPSRQGEDRAGVETESDRLAAIRLELTRQDSI